MRASGESQVQVVGPTVGVLDSKEKPSEKPSALSLSKLSEWVGSRDGSWLG